MKTVLATFVILFIIHDVDSVGDEFDAMGYLHTVSRESEKLCNVYVRKAWNFYTNITDHNKKLMVEQKIMNEKHRNEIGKNVTKFQWRNFRNPTIKRQFKYLADIGSAALSDEKIAKLAKIEADMQENYSKAKICPYNTDPFENEKCDLNLEPDLVRIMKNSRDYNELLHVWREWREKAGKPVRQQFLEMVRLQNEAARLNGFADTGEAWRDNYESKDFMFEIEELMEMVKPFYKQLHAFVRRKLVNKYGSEKVSPTGGIPAHLLGNMWAQSWTGLVEEMMPFPDRPKVDITETLVLKKYSARKVFEIAEEFFTSLGLEKMPELFWNKSMLERPTDGRDVVCHASAWDMCAPNDFRVKQCTELTMDQFVTAHHEMGHIQYYLLYANQPYLFRDGANYGFHEALGDLIALSVTTPKHLNSIGLLPEYKEDYEADINFLFSMAMDKVAFLPFGYLMDQWRWRVFSGEVTERNLNEAWWEMRLQFQGLEPPTERTEDDFDPGAKYHISSNVPYVRYFVSTVLQFQFHETLCKLSGHVGPLHKCDIYRSKAAGARLRNVLSLGSSTSWREQMKTFTDGKTDKMDTSSIRNYFQPLMDWLEKANADEQIGWDFQGTPFKPNFKSRDVPGAATTLSSVSSSLVIALCYVLGKLLF